MISGYLLLAVASLGYGLLLTGILGRLGSGAYLPSGLRRKAFHAGIFTGAVPAQLLLDFWGVVLYGSVISALVVLSLLRGPGSVLYGILVREEDGEDGSRLIVLPLLSTAFGGLMSVFLVGAFAVVGYLVCGWGDAAGEIIGRRWGQRRFTPPFSVGRRRHARTMEGSAAVLFVGVLAAIPGLLLLGVSILPALGVGLVVGMVGALAEGLSGHGTDNFWVQLAPSITAWWLVG